MQYDTHDPYIIQYSFPTCHAKGQYGEHKGRKYAKGKW